MARLGRPKAPAPDLPAIAEAFLEMLAAERGAAALTIEAYGRDLADFGAFLAPTDLKEASEETRCAAIFPGSKPSECRRAPPRGGYRRSGSSINSC